MAISPAGIRVTCGFSVIVNGPPAVRVTLEGNGTQLDFGQGAASRRSDPNPTLRTFMIENVGCGTLNLTHESTMRTGADVDSGKITNPDDRDTFVLTVVNSDGSERVSQCTTAGPCITIAPGQKLTFRVRFNRVIPPYAGKTTGLAAREVLPDLVTSKITFTQNGGSPFIIPLTGRVTPQVQLVNPSRTKKNPKVTFERAGNEFIITLGFYDPNLNTTRIRYELLRNDGSVAETIEVDIAGPISSINPVKGQALKVEQRFTGASDNQDVVGVRVTIIDGEGSDAISTSRASPVAAASMQTSQVRAGATRVLPVKINP